MLLKDGKPMHANGRPSHDPTVFVRICGLACVIVGNVLQVADTRIEAQPPTRADVPQTHPSCRCKDPTIGGPRRKFEAGVLCRSHPRTLTGKGFTGFLGPIAKSVDVCPGKWFPLHRMLNIVCAQPSGHRSSSANAAAAVASYWHATKPAVAAAMFTNKRPSQRPDRSPT